MAALEPHGVQPVDVSLTLTGSAQLLVGQDLNRSYLQFQAPQGSTLIYSFTNPTPVANGSGCFTLAAGQTYLSGYVVPTGRVWVNGTAAGVVAACVG